MVYKTSATVDFECDRQTVYKALCYLGRHPEWSQGMIYISHTGPMYPGLRYQTRSRVMGQINAADVEVVNLVPNELVRVKNESGLIGFDAVFLISEEEGGRSKVTCRLAFKFHYAVMNLARPAIESMARDRIQNDLMKLAGILRREHMSRWF